MYTAKERIYLNAEGKVVKESDPSAAFLLCGEGCRLSDAEARKYGLLDEEKAQEKVSEPAAPEPEPAPEPEAKAVRPAQDKAVKSAPRNK